MIELDTLKECASKVFANIVFPIYIKIDNNVFVFTNNVLKRINVSDYFVGQLRENKFTIKGKFKDELIDFYILHMYLLDRNVAFIIPVVYDINKLLSHVFCNIIDIYRELMDLKTKLEKKQLELANISTKLQEKEDENSKLYINLSVLLDEKKKLENILNGQEVALFVVDEHYNIIYGNDSLARILKYNDVKYLVNKKCYKHIFNKAEPCEWCKMIDIYNLQKQFNQKIDITLDHSKFSFDQLMYPVIVDGKVINVVETLNDITQYIELLESIEKIDLEKQQIAKRNIDNIKEIGALRKAYNELYNEYLKNKEQLDKLNILTSKLVEFNNVQKTIDIVNQLKKFSQINKIQERKLENYAKRINTYETKIKELRQKAIYEVNRLGNIVKNRKEMSNDELNGILAFLEKQINTYIKEDEYVD
jgi:PAS domain-containing protein